MSTVNDGDNKTTIQLTLIQLFIINVLTTAKRPVSDTAQEHKRKYVK
jgi:hypothetical protein